MTRKSPRSSPSVVVRSPARALIDPRSVPRSCGRPRERLSSRGGSSAAEERAYLGKPSRAADREAAATASEVDDARRRGARSRATSARIALSSTPICALSNEITAMYASPRQFLRAATLPTMRARPYTAWATPRRRLSQLCPLSLPRLERAARQPWIAAAR